MAFLTLNGLELDALMDSGSEEDREIGEGLSEAFDGSALRSVRAYKRHWTFQSIIDSPLAQRAWRRFLQGRWHHWSFDADLFSDDGLGPSSSALATIVGGGIFGSALQIGATTGLITYAGLGGFPYNDGFTLLIQRKEAGIWVDYHFTWTAAGALSAVYKDAVVQATALPAWVVSYTHATGTLILGNTTGAGQLYDEMVTLTFEAPLSLWSAQLDAWRNGNAWSGPGKLVLAGTMPNTSFSVMGKASAAKQQRATIEGVSDDGQQSFQFELFEA